MGTKLWIPRRKKYGHEDRRRQERWFMARQTLEVFSEEVAFKVALRYRRLQEVKRAFQVEEKGIPADL